MKHLLVLVLSPLLEPVLIQAPFDLRFEFYLYVGLLRFALALVCDGVGPTGTENSNIFFNLCDNNIIK